MNNLKFNKILWSVTTALALIAATYGLFNNDIYKGLMPIGFVAAQFTQDILTILVCIVLAVLIYRTKEASYKASIVIIGIVGSLAYLYGIFSIERVYNSMYLVYLAILSVSVYTLIYSIASLKPELVAKVQVSRPVRNTTAVISLLIGSLFSMLWIGALLPLMKSGEQIDNLFSIFLLDLAFVMPAFFITAIMTFRNKPLGYMLTPIVYITGIFVIFPLGLGELAKMLPQFNLTPDFKSMTMSFILAGLFIAGAAVQLWKMKLVKAK